MWAAITGANGFIGGALLRQFRAAGWRTTALSRSPRPEFGEQQWDWMPYTLERGLGNILPPECDVIVHCAYGMGPHGQSELELNVRAVNTLRNQTSDRRFVFVSSLSAHDRARSAYGTGKRQIEAMLNRSTDLIIKPGLVIGSGGLFARIRNSLHRLPFVPLFYGGNQPIQTIWIGDLVDGIRRAVQMEITEPLALASEQAIPLREFYGAILRNDHLCRPLVRIPGELSLVALKMCEKIGVRLPVTSENLLGLSALRRFETKPSLELLGLELLSLNQALRNCDEAENMIRSA